MAVSLPNGSTVAMASAYGAAKTITAITNANPAVASSTAHGFAVGDIIEITSGWSRLNNKVVRVGAVTTDTFVLEGINTISTTLYPAGSGIGSAREATTFQQVAQVLDSSSSGGDQQFVTYSFMEQDFETQIPTVKSASALSFQIADDPNLPQYPVIEAANDDRLPRAFRITLASGGILLYNMYVSLNKTPTLTKNQVMALTLSLAMLNEPVRYAS
ncbi:phage tail protein [Pseudomonas sp. YH-1]|uniref:phage tail protein n=1 Tax=Pseudomonas sp. YH-1 TaxID=3384787 RepID=UPI003F7ED021